MRAPSAAVISESAIASPRASPGLVESSTDAGDGRGRTNEQAAAVPSSASETIEQVRAVTWPASPSVAQRHPVHLGAVGAVIVGGHPGDIARPGEHGEEGKLGARDELRGPRVDDLDDGVMDPVF